VLLPTADLPDLVLEIAAKTGFIDASPTTRSPAPSSTPLATSLCAVLVAQACNVGYKPLVDESNPALREARLRYVAQRYLRPKRWPRRTPESSTSTPSSRSPSAGAAARSRRSTQRQKPTVRNSWSACPL
jgi:hypothetical protein